MTSWITAEAAQALLGVKLQTLYAYTSRGLIANRPDAEDPRRSLYAADDIDRLTVRKMRGRRASVAHEAMNFGEPVMASAITTITGGRLYYRGRDAAALSDTMTLEIVLFDVQDHVYDTTVLLDNFRWSVAPLTLSTHE